MSQFEKLMLILAALRVYFAAIRTIDQVLRKKK